MTFLKQSTLSFSCRNRFYFLVPTAWVVMMPVISFEHALASGYHSGLPSIYKRRSTVPGCGHSTLDRKQRASNSRRRRRHYFQYQKSRQNEGPRDAYAFLEFLQNLDEILCSDREKTKDPTDLHEGCCLNSADQL